MQLARETRETRETRESNRISGVRTRGALEPLVPKLTRRARSILGLELRLLQVCLEADPAEESPAKESPAAPELPESEPPDGPAGLSPCDTLAEDAPSLHTESGVLMIRRDAAAAKLAATRKGSSGRPMR